MAMSGLGGVIAGAVAKQIVSKLLVGGDYAASEVALQWRYREDVLKLGEKMKDVEAVLGDADAKLRGQGQEGGQVYERWLTKFKRAAYDVEDVIDELDANELIKKTQPKASLWFSRNNQLLQRITMSHKMKKVMKKIDVIEKEGRTRLNLVPQQARAAQGSRNNQALAANWNAHGMETGMVGRGVEKEKIISLLLTSEEANHDIDISIIPVVGLGGIGKTTLAESVLADKRVSVFDVSVWVKVSKQFDLHKIGSAVLKSMMNTTINNLDSCDLQLHLKKELATRRYLIVLDDLWEEEGNNLERLKEMLQHGRKGSRIIVTTRNLSVVQQLRTGFLANQRKLCPVPESETVELGVLEPGDCWELMKQRAFGPDDDHSGLEEIGKQIAGKCGGLPLVANALGQVMSELRTVGAWEDIRDTKVDLGLREGHQKETLERLMLSYYYMKIEFKMCFTYLAAFSKGFVMDSNRLIQQWNALGYICPGYDGQRCINYLLGMSFLRIPGSASVSPSPLHLKAPPELVMHDLVHDLASIIVADEFIHLDATKSTSWNRARYCRHAQLTNFKNDPEVFKYIPHKLRSLHFRDLGGPQLPKKAFSRSKYIRVLDLSGHSAKGQSAPSSVVLPSSVNQLKLIRYLDATGLPITSLPKYFHQLQNMETLILSKSLLESLPDSICRLSKLCYLDLSGSSSLSKLPASLGELSKLLFLNLSGCCILQELPESICELTSLHHLDMSDCCALQMLPAKFDGLFKLSFLNLSSCSNLTKLPDNIRFPCLEHLNLSSCHGLQVLPIDFGNLQELEFMNLSGCYKVSMLPGSFCQLIHLKYLDLSDCHNLLELPECFGHLFELEYLNLTSCAKLRQLPESLCKLFKLKCLYLSYCVRLSELPSSFGDLKLQILHMNGLPEIHDCPDSIGDMTSLTQFLIDSATSDTLEKVKAIKKRLNFVGEVEHNVHVIETSGCSSIVDLVGLTCSELVLKNIQNVRNPEDADRVKLRDKSNIRVLKLFWENEGGGSVLERLIPPRTLESFWLAGYRSNKFPDWMLDISSYLPFLSELTLGDLEACDCLPPFGALPNLRKLYLENISNIRKIGKEFYGEGGPCMKLRVLMLRLMDNLVEWWTTKSSKENQEFLIPNLHLLEVMDCPKLKFLPYPPTSMKWYLSNSETVLPEQGFGKLSSSICPSEMILMSSSFSQDKWDGLQYFPTLEKFQVISVSGLRTLPDVMRCFTSLTELYLSSLKDLETLPVWLGHLGSLVEIGIHDCPNLTSLPESMKNLTALKTLRLLECKGLETLPEWLGQLTSLEILFIRDCPNLTSLPESMKNLITLKKLRFKECKALETLPGWLGQLTSLEEISISDYPNLTSFAESMKNLAALKKLMLIQCKGMETLPGWLGQLTSLEDILIAECPNLTSLPESMKNLTALRKLNVLDCKGMETLPGWLGQLTCLEEIVIDDYPNLTSLPESMKNLAALKKLTLIQCTGLEILPGWLGQLTCLEELTICYCPKLTSLPGSIRSLSSLKLLRIVLCPILTLRCQGEDTHKICHIPKVEFAQEYANVFS